MKTYLVTYYKEINDECVDCEIEIQCDNFWQVEQKFHEKIRVYKKVISCVEINKKTTILK